MAIKFRSTLFNIIEHYPASFDRVTKHVEHVEFNNVGRCWREMLEQYHLTRWPNAFNVLNSTMMEAVEWILESKHVQHVEFNNVGRCWTEMLNQHDST